MACTFSGAKGFWGRLYAAVLQVEESQVLAEEADLPDLVVDLSDADALAGEDGAEA